jgi:hypothetical protein
LSKQKLSKGYTERISVGFTLEQMRRIEEILRVRARRGEMQHKTDVVRDAVNLYLSHQDDIPGTRAAITRKLEGRIEAVEEQLQQQNQLLDKISGFLRKKRANG